MQNVSGLYLDNRQHQEGFTFVKRIGIIIIIVGLFTILYTSFPYIMREKVSEFDKLEKTNDKEYTVNLQLYAGIGMIVVGGIVFVLGVNRKDEKEILKK